MAESEFNYEIRTLQCKTPEYADLDRGGGSYSFGYKAKNGKRYELFLKVVVDLPADCKRYFEPLVFPGDVTFRMNKSTRRYHYSKYD